MRVSSDLQPSNSSAPLAALACAARLQNNPCLQEVRSLAIAYFRDEGVDATWCLRLPTDARSLAPDVLVDDRPADWTRRYLERGMQASDPILQAVRMAGRPIAWSEALAGRRLSKAAREVVATARDFGMREGLAIPIYDTHGLTGAVDLAGRELALSPATRTGLALVAVTMFHCLKAHDLQRSAARRLTRREIEVLEWILDGKSDWQIGQILKVSAKTVNFHVENAKRKFGVATRIQAVVAAARQGSIRC